MKEETPIVSEKKLEEFDKLAAVGRAVNAMVEACEINNETSIEDLTEIVVSMSIRRMRKHLPRYSPIK